MGLHVFVFLLVFCLILGLAWLWRLCWLHQGPAPTRAAVKLRNRLPRLRHRPAAQTIAPPVVLPPLPPRVQGQRMQMSRPWSEVKSCRGTPKRIDTQGFACPNRKCPYFGMTDAHIHALVGDGKHGRLERIQTFRCQACHTTFTARRDMPLYRLKTSSHQIEMVLSALAEGLDPSAAERVFGYRQATITTWLTRAGKHAQTLHERSFCRLQLPHLQLDELRTRLRFSQHVRLSVARHRPLHENSSGPASGPPNTTHGPSRHPFPTRALGPWLHSALHQ